MKNKAGKIIETSSWVIMSILLIKFVPRNRIREAWVIFSFKQFMTWLFGLMVVEKNLISYPSRLFFKKATRSSFTFEYFVYPALCILFNLYYPQKKSKKVKLLYHFSYTSSITVLEIIALKYTKLIKYKNWKWYWTFFTLWITYYLSHIHHQWFFKDRSVN
jgi:hypothetical protein